MSFRHRGEQEHALWHVQEGNALVNKKELFNVPKGNVSGADAPVTKPVQALIEGGADIHATIEGNEEQDARYFAEQALQAEIADAPYKARLVPYKYRRVIELLMH